MRAGSAAARAALAALSLFAVGCATAPSPYDYVENWLIREDPVRAFVVPADVIYLQNDLYADAGHVSIMHSYAKAEVGNGRFAGVARVFSPLVSDAEDVRKALDWYFRHHHEKGRPFIFIGEGEGGALLRAYEEANAEKLKKIGLAASFYTEAARKGFVTDEMVREARLAASRVRFRNIWGREMPVSDTPAAEPAPSAEPDPEPPAAEPSAEPPAEADEDYET